MGEQHELRKHDFKWDFWVIYKITEAIFSMIGTFALLSVIITMGDISQMIFLVLFAVGVLEFQVFERRFFPKYKQSRAVSLVWIWVPAIVEALIILCILISVS